MISRSTREPRERGEEAAMAKASPAASHTARPASLRSSSRAAASGSSSAIPRPPLPAAVNTRDVSSNCKVTAGETNEMVEEEEPLPDQVNLALAELHGGRGLSPRSKRLIADVLELLAAERNPTATTLRLRRAAFWGKVRVCILAATVVTVAAIDIALAVALISRRRSSYYYDGVLPPT